MSAVSPVDCFRISKPCFITQNSGNGKSEMGNGKSEIGTQAMKMPIPASHGKPL